MDMHARNEYLKALADTYMKATRKNKGRVLDEYCRNTRQSRKYVIRKIWKRSYLIPKKKTRKSVYTGYVIDALAKVWKIFDCPCGQRLFPLLKIEVERLRRFRELEISDDTANKLRKISSATIDRKLAHERTIMGLSRYRGRAKSSSLLKFKIPVRMGVWNAPKLGYVEADLVQHCGASLAGEFVNTVSATEISTGWWEGEAIMGKSQRFTFQALRNIRSRCPFEWKGLDSDNGVEFINHTIDRYCEGTNLEFTRSRPYHKNDNAHIEQKNWTHVRQTLGYLRYDTHAELSAINSLYRNELRLYKNFFQPVMKLARKERIGGSIKRKLAVPKTPYQRLMESRQLPENDKRKLRKLYLSLNPALLKRNIDCKIDALLALYQSKTRRQAVNPHKKLNPRPLNTVTFYMMDKEAVGLPT